MRHDPRKTFGQHWVGAFVSYVVLDLLCTALGMGVPLFAIMLGFSVGWFAAWRAMYFLQETRAAMIRVLRYALLCAAVTAVSQAVIWGWLVPKLFDPVVNPGNMGLPLLLYEPKASLAGWLVLMIVVSPLLQFSMVVLGAYLTVAFLLKRPFLYQAGPRD
jgi:hypothetical protein